MAHTILTQFEIVHEPVYIIQTSWGILQPSTLLLFEVQLNIWSIVFHVTNNSSFRYILTFILVMTIRTFHGHIDSQCIIHCFGRWLLGFSFLFFVWLIFELNFFEWKTKKDYHVYNFGSFSQMWGKKLRVFLQLHRIFFFPLFW